MRFVRHVAIYLYWLHGGGIPRVMVHLANGFIERGLCVDFVLGKAEGPHLNALSPDVRVIAFGKSGAFPTIPNLVRYLKRETPDVLLTGNTHLNIVALIAHRLAQVRTAIIVSEHAEYFQQQAARRRRSPPMAWLMPRLMARTYPWADRIVGVSRGVTDSLREAFPLLAEKLCTIWNPVIDDSLYRQAQEAVSHPWLCQTEIPVILAAGRLTYQKNFTSLVRAFAIVRRQVTAKLIICGEGEDRPMLEALVRDLGLEHDVDLPGYVDNLYAFMRRASLFVLPSRWEGLGLVLIEALACGTPVVATDCPSGPREIVEQAGMGRLVPPEDEKALAHAILEELTKGREGKGKPNLEPFTVQFAVESYLELFKQVIEERCEAMSEAEAGRAGSGKTTASPRVFTGHLDRLNVPGIVLSQRKDHEQGIRKVGQLEKSPVDRLTHFP